MTQVEIQSRKSPYEGVHAGHTLGGVDTHDNGNQTVYGADGGRIIQPDPEVKPATGQTGGTKGIMGT